MFYSFIFFFFLFLRKEIFLKSFRREDKNFPKIFQNSFIRRKAEKKKKMFWSFLKKGKIREKRKGNREKKDPSQKTRRADISNKKKLLYVCFLLSPVSFHSPFLHQETKAYFSFPAQIYCFL